VVSNAARITIDISKPENTSLHLKGHSQMASARSFAAKRQAGGGSRYEAASGASLVETTYALSQALPGKAGLTITRYFSSWREVAFGRGFSAVGCF